MTSSKSGHPTGQRGARSFKIMEPPSKKRRSEGKRVLHRKINASTTAEICGRIADGSFAMVFKGKLISRTLCNGMSTTPCALRISKPSKDGRPRREPSEMERCRALLAGLAHPNIVKLAHPSIFYIDGQEAVAMELGQLDLFEFFHKSGTVSANPDLAWAVALDVCNALRYLHTAPVPIAHLDIKSENVVVFPGPVYKLTDFGCARPIGTELESSIGTRQYLPSWWLGTSAGPFRVSGAEDFYSLALLCAELTTAVLLEKATQQRSLLARTMTSPNAEWIAQLVVGQPEQLLAALP